MNRQMSRVKLNLQTTTYRLSQIPRSVILVLVVHSDVGCGVVSLTLDSQNFHQLYKLFIINRNQFKIHTFAGVKAKPSVYNLEVVN